MVVRLFVLFTVLFSVTGYAKSIQLSAQNATLSFAGEHAGRAFEGRFTHWQADLILPDSASDTGAVNATFALSSAKTGSRTYDGTLPEQDWFYVERYPQGVFVADTVIQQGSDYRIVGQLTLRDQTHPIEFLLRVEDEQYIGHFQIDRILFQIGLDSDPDAEWVSQFINMTLRIKR